MAATSFPSEMDRGDGHMPFVSDHSHSNNFSRPSPRFGLDFFTRDISSLICPQGSSALPTNPPTSQRSKSSPSKPRTHPTTNRSKSSPGAPSSSRLYPPARYPSFRDSTSSAPRYPLLDLWANAVLMSSVAASDKFESRAQATADNSQRTRQQSTAPIKLLTLGDSGAGKSSLLLRYTQDRFSEEFISTIGMDFKVKRTKVDGEPVRVQLWDTAGQERFRSITKNYYHGAHGVLLVYDLTHPKGLKNARRWALDFENLHAGIDRVLIGNKLDLLDRRSGAQRAAVEAGQRLAADLGIPFHATSAKTNENVEEAFMSLIERVYRRLQNASESPRNGGHSSSGKVNIMSGQSKSSTGCCS